jgi:hypothetical protein
MGVEDSNTNHSEKFKTKSFPPKGGRVNALMTAGHPRVQHKFLAMQMPSDFSQLCSRKRKHYLCFPVCLWSDRA